MVTTTADLTVIPSNDSVIITYWTDDTSQSRRVFSTLGIREFVKKGGILDNLPIAVSQCALAYLLINAEDDSFFVTLLPMYRVNGIRVEFS